MKSSTFVMIFFLIPSYVCVQVHIPPPKLNRGKDGEGLVPITDLEAWAQLAFKGTKRLNPMQSKVLYIL